MRAGLPGLPYSVFPGRHDQLDMPPFVLGKYDPDSYHGLEIGHCYLSRCHDPIVPGDQKESSRKDDA